MHLPLSLPFLTTLLTLAPLLLASNIPTKDSNINERDSLSPNTVNAYKRSGINIDLSTLVSRNLTSVTGSNSTGTATGTGIGASGSGTSGGEGSGGSGTGTGVGSGSGSGSNSTTSSTGPSKPANFQGAASTTVAGFSVVCGAAALSVFALM